MPIPDLVEALTPRVDAFLGLFDEPEFETPEVDDTGRAILDLRGHVGPFGLDAELLSPMIRKLDAKVIEINLSSPGGNVWHGVDIANTLRQHSATVEINVMGVAASAGSVIAAAGDQVAMWPGSMMMVHNGRGFIDGGTAEQCRGVADLLDKVNVNMADIYSARAGGTRAEWLETMAAESWFTGEEAVDAGLADVVVTNAADGRDDSGESGTEEAGHRRAPVAGSSPVLHPSVLAQLANVFGWTYQGRGDAPDPVTHSTDNNPPDDPPADPPRSISPEVIARMFTPQPDAKALAAAFTPRKETADA